MNSKKQPNSFHAYVIGNVQGVGYRMFARETAIRMRCRGWVRNLSNGQVEIYAEGDEMTLTELLTELLKGPPWSHVEKIDVSWEHKEQLDEQKFRILR